MKEHAEVEYVECVIDLDESFERWKQKSPEEKEKVSQVLIRGVRTLAVNHVLEKYDTVPMQHRHLRGKYVYRHKGRVLRQHPMLAVNTVPRAVRYAKRAMAEHGYKETVQ